MAYFGFYVLFARDKDRKNFHAFALVRRVLRLAEDRDMVYPEPLCSSPERKGKGKGKGASIHENVASCE